MTQPNDGQMSWPMAFVLVAMILALVWVITGQTILAWCLP